MAAAWQRATEELHRLEDDPARLLSIALNLALSIPIALLIGVPTAGVGAGLLLGLLVAFVAYLRMRVHERGQERRREQLIADVHVDADDRVAIVTKQYQWAVNDIANLRDALRRAEARALAAEQRLQTTTPTTDPLPLVPRAREGDATTLRFESDGAAPAQIRILEDADVVGISSRVLESRPDQSSAFVVNVSERVAAGVRAGDPRFTLEALVGEQWRRVAVRQTWSAVPSDVVTDKRGRVYSAANEPAPRLAFSIADE